MFSIEEIPNEELLFRRIHKTFLDKDGLPIPGGFKGTKEEPDSISTNWNRYSTSHDTRNQARSPEDNAVVSLVAGEARSVETIQVKHEPIIGNRAHSAIQGRLTTKIRMNLRDLCKMELPLKHS